MKTMFLAIVIITSSHYILPQQQVFNQMLFEVPCNIIDSLGGFDITPGISSLGDWTGDSKDEFMFLTCNGPLIGYKYLIYEGGSPSGTPPRYVMNAKTSGDYWDMKPRIYDFNKDGYRDIIKIELSQPKTDSVFVYFGGPGFDTLADYKFPLPYEEFNLTRAYSPFAGTIADFNGDGVEDLIFNNASKTLPGGQNYGAYVFFNLVYPFNPSEWVVVRADTLVSKDGFLPFRLTSGDVNGDGYDDLMFAVSFLNPDFSRGNPKGSRLVFGNSSYSFEQNIFISNDTASAEFVRIIPDINGDGLSEVMWVGSYHNGGRIHISYGRPGPDYTIRADYSFFIDGFTINSPILFGDINKDGYQDIGLQAYTSGDGTRIILGGPRPLLLDFLDRNERLIGNVGDFNGDGVDDFAAGQFPGDGGGACARSWVGNTLYFKIRSGDINAINPSGIEDELLPEGYNIEINPYPNPFNPEVKIEYHLPGAGHVKLSVFSSLGEEIFTKNLSYRNKGKDETTLDFSGLNVPSGVYLLRLTLRTPDKGTLVKNTKLAFMK